MIDLYYFPSPNTWKVAIMLEECGLDYRVKTVDIVAGEQSEPDFLAISPNGRVPAIVDHDAGGTRQPLFESGAILLYLAEKTGRFLPDAGPDRAEALQWLFWQHGGLGPMAGQAHHFRRYKAEGNDYAVERYTAECQRLYGVLDRRLEARDWIAGDYGVADMASWGWVWFHRMHGVDLGEYPEVARWFFAMAERPAVQRARQAGMEDVPPEVAAIYDGPYFDDDATRGAEHSYVKSPHEDD
jgi:GST-like protein